MVNAIPPALAGVVCLDALSQNPLPAGSVGQRHFHGGEVDVGGDHMEPIGRPDTGVGKRRSADEHVVGGAGMEPGLHAGMERGMGLWIEIDQADVLPRPGQSHGEIH